MKIPAFVTRWEPCIVVIDIVHMKIDVNKMLENGLVSKEVGHSTRNGFLIMYSFKFPLKNGAKEKYRQTLAEKFKISQVWINEVLMY